MTELQHVDLRDVIPEESYFEGTWRERYLQNRRANPARLPGAHDFYYPHRHFQGKWEHQPAAGWRPHKAPLISSADHSAHVRPAVRREIHREMLGKRRVVLRELEVLASVHAIDPANDGHLRWVAALESLAHEEAWLHATEQSHAHLWDLHAPYRTPEGIPAPPIETLRGSGISGSYTPDQRLGTLGRAYYELSLYDVEHGALLELEESVGGPASIALHDRLTTTATVIVGGVRAPGTTERNDARRRVGNYLTYYRALKNVEDLPRDPYDPLHWGHDSRLSSLAVRAPNHGRVAVLTPDFDPDVHEYTADIPIVQATTIAGDFFDPLLGAGDVKAMRGDNMIGLKVTSKSGFETTDYRVHGAEAQ